jgi:serine/threonine protein kinase
MEESLDIHIPWPGWHAVRRLGRGSYGSVWEIEREVAGKPERCALKVVGVPPEGGYDDSLDMGYDEESVTAAYGERADTVLREYQLMASLAHPNVISVKDVGKVRHEDTPGYDVFIRMELLEPLPAWARGRSVFPVDVAHVGHDIASALAACESEAIVHRDVKPANIFADRWGTFKLGDFGVARNLEGTCTATMAGTQSYMAPEVARHERYNQTVDVYSLGLVMWWMLDGYRLPFMPEGRLSPGDNTRAEARRLSGEEIPAPEGCPEELARIVLKACAYRSEERYQSATEMMADLDNFPAKAAITSAIPEQPNPAEHGRADTQIDLDSNWEDDEGATVGRGFESTPLPVESHEVGETDAVSFDTARIGQTRKSIDGRSAFGNHDSWIPCDYSSVTSSHATEVVGACDDGTFVLRCEDGSTVVTTSGEADGDMLEEVAGWTNLQKVCFGEYCSSDSGDVSYALGLRDDGSFVSTSDDLAEAIAACSLGSRCGIVDFAITGPSEIQIITDSGKWQKLALLQNSSVDMPDGPPYLDKPARAFPANAEGTAILLTQGGTCWSSYGEGFTCGDAIRSWTSIVQCIDGASIYAAVDSDGRVHAATWHPVDDEEYEKCLRLAEGIAGWNGIRKLDGIYGTFLGVTFEGDLLLGEFDYWDDAPAFNTYDLGISGIVDAAVADCSASDGGLIVAIDDNGNVAIASVGELEEARSAISIRRQKLR